MLRNNLQRERGGVGEVRHAVDAGNRRHRSPAADIDEDALRGEPFASDSTSCGATNRAWPRCTVQFSVARSEASVAALHDATMASLRCFTRRMSTDTPPPTTTPNSAARRAMCAA